MITVKIQCACGQRYAFDVEDSCVNFPSPISCPSCGADGTAAADAVFAQSPARTVSRPQLAKSTSSVGSPARPRVSRTATQPNDDDIRDLIEAKLNVKRAVSVAFIFAAIHSLLGLLSLFGYSILGAGPFKLLHAGILLGLGYGTHRFSRTCAVTLALYYLADTAYSWLSSNEVGGIIVFTVALYFFARGAQATFTYHRLQRSDRSGKPVSVSNFSS